MQVARCSATSPITAYSTSGSSSSVDVVRAWLQGLCGDEQRLLEINKKIEEILEIIKIEEKFLDGKNKTRIIEVKGHELPIIIKPRHCNQAYREVLAYRLSEKLGLHLVPPTWVKDNVVVQLWLVDFHNEIAYGSASDLSAAGQMFHYIVDQPDDNPRHRLRYTSMCTERNILMLINHAQAFWAQKIDPLHIKYLNDTLPTARHEIIDKKIKDINVGNIFTQEKWEQFLFTSADQWQTWLTNEASFLTAEDHAEFLRRIEVVKQSVVQQITAPKCSLQQDTLSPAFSLHSERGKFVCQALGKFGLTLASDVNTLPIAAVAAVLSVYGNYAKAFVPRSNISPATQLSTRSRILKWVEKHVSCVRSSEAQLESFSDQLRRANSCERKIRMQHSLFMPTLKSMEKTLQEHSIRYTTAISLKTSKKILKPKPTRPV